jgi:choline-sulfatase
MRGWWMLGAAAAVGLAVAAPWRVWTREWAVRGGADRPDVLIVTLDTTRADRIGAYGGDPAVTPTLDRLARGGVRFDRAYSHAPTTLPSHASLFTGLTPARHGVHENAVFTLRDAVPTLAEAFARAGYRTGAFVSAIVLDRRYGLARGFGVYADEVESDDSEAVNAQVPAAVTVDRALAFLGTGAPDPVLAWVHLYDPHQPYAPPEPFATRFRGRAYEGEIAYMDAEIDRLLAGLAARQRPALVVAVADHGESLGEHGEATHAFFIYSATQRVPLILSYPGVLPAGVTVAPTVRAVDVMPTVLALAGLTTPDGLDGSSLVPLITGRSDASPGPVYLESYGPRLWWGAQELLGVRSGPWLFIRAPRPELYQVEDDPAERTDLAATRRQETARLSDELEALVPDGDPLAQQTATDPETARRLRALGYLGGANPLGASGTSALADPKDVAPVLAAIAEAQGFMNRREYDRALAAFRALAPRMPSSGQLRGRIASALLALKRYDEALVAYRALHAESPDDEGYVLGVARALFHLGRVDDAVALVRDALQTAADSAVLHLQLGTLLEDAGRLADAEPAYQRAVELSPREPAPLLAWASISDKQGRADEAARRFARVVDVSPHSSQGRQAGRRLAALAEQFARAGQRDAARDAYDAAIRSGQVEPAAYLNAALVHVQLGGRRAATEVLEQGAARHPTAADLHARLAALYLEAGQTSGADASFRRALAIDPTRRDAQLGLARVLESTGRRDDAVTAYDAVARLTPPSRETQLAAEALRRLGLAR